ncbi:hypothetical protein C6380_17460 [Pseudomonas syringae pv. actinidiae]|nr:hypothetical protein C6380_17460 [Pseudomonas syringae pv. actinidiae]
MKYQSIGVWMMSDNDELPPPPTPRRKIIPKPNGLSFADTLPSPIKRPLSAFFKIVVASTV